MIPPRSIQDKHFVVYKVSVTFSGVFDHPKTGQFALQASTFQLKVTNLNDSETEKVIAGSGPIQLFCVNVDDDLVCAVINMQLEFFSLSSTAQISLDSSLLYHDSQILFLFDRCLWLGKFEMNAISWTVQKVNNHPSVKNFVVKVAGLTPKTVLCDYRVNGDKLVLAMVGLGVIIYKLDGTPKMVEVGRFHAHAPEQPPPSCPLKVALNKDNSLAMMVSEDNCIHIHDLSTSVTADHRLDLPADSQLTSVHFDGQQLNSFCVQVKSTCFLMVYLASTNQVVMHETLELSDVNALAVVALVMPCLFTLSTTATTTNVVSKQTCPELSFYLLNQDAIHNLLSCSADAFSSLVENEERSNEIMTRIAIKRCIQDRNVKAAIICVSKIGDARLVRDLKNEWKQSGTLAACALLAINFNLHGQAETLFKLAGMNKLCKYYQMQDKWHETFVNADKILIKSLYYDYARQLESENKISDAIKYYELSGNTLQIPRMLFETGNLNQIDEYCMAQHNGQTNPALVTWLGQYCESQGDTKSALEMYETAHDYYNMVRLMCHVDHVDMAISLVNESLHNGGPLSAAAGTDNDSVNNQNLIAATLYLGKHLEMVNNSQSIHFYLKCGALLHAIRVCVANEMYEDLTRIAVENCSVDEARHILENYADNIIDSDVSRESVIKLYYKCGLVQNAIEMAIEDRHWPLLKLICQQEIAHRDSATAVVVGEHELNQALEALKSNSSIVDIVIDMFILSDQKNFADISSIIQEYNIILNESLIEQLETFAETHHHLDGRAIQAMAEICLQQGQYQIAAKLYNKIGQRQDSLKALMRHGDRDKVIQFARVARDKTVFKLAANYLQTINYSDSGLIIQFYTKAEAMDELHRYQASLGQSPSSTVDTINGDEEDQEDEDAVQ